MGIILITVIIAVAATFFICNTKCVALERENENLMNEVEVLKSDKAELAQSLSDAQSECLAVAEEASAKEKSLQGTILDQCGSLNAITAEIKALKEESKKKQEASKLKIMELENEVMEKGREFATMMSNWERKEGGDTEELSDAVAEAEQLEDKRATPKKAVKATKATKPKKQ